MTRTRWLLLGVLAMVAVTAIVLSRRGPAGITVDTVRATRQSRFVRHNVQQRSIPSGRCVMSEFRRIPEVS